MSFQGVSFQKKLRKKPTSIGRPWSFGRSITARSETTILLSEF